MQILRENAAIEVIISYYCLFFALLPIHRERDIKIAQSCLRINIEATQREGPLTQLSARGISSAAVRSPFYCRLRSRPLFLVLFPSCFLRLPSSDSLFLPRSLPPALFVRTLSARLRQLPPSSLLTRSTDPFIPSPFILLSFSALIVSFGDSKSGNDCSELQ